jgi:hypothetical protein
MMEAKKTAETAADGVRAGGEGQVDAAELELARQLAERARDEMISGRIRRFARWSAICSCALGMAG